MNPNSPPQTILQDEDDLFYFESDHLALKGNKDYSEVLKTIFILESQRARAITDYDAVVELHKQALNDPELFLQKIKNGEPLGVPDLQIIAEVPNIHWSKYKVTLPEEGLKFVKEQNSHKIKNANFSIEENSFRNKLDTHNKPWTTEEQKRLEELLVIYPPEPIEFRRFKKIAAALGNRTVKQVSSRIQKYFIKLYKAGLPIPGRIPKYAERCKKSKLHLHQRHNHYLFKPTTFFPELDVPVVMNECEEVPGPSTDTTNNTSFVNYLIPSSYQPVVEQTPSEEPKNDLDIQLNILRKVKLEKETENAFQSSFHHFGYKCDYCNEEPIVGTRWHCELCATQSVDFCSDCVISQMYSETSHPLSHRLEPVRYDDVVTSTNYSDSSSESISGSAFESSNKNFDSSDEESSSSAATEQFEETQNSSESCDYANLNFKYDEEEEEEEDEGDVNDYNDYNSNFKTVNIYEDYKENHGEGYGKDGEEDYLVENEKNNMGDFQEHDDEVGCLEEHDDEVGFLEEHDINQLASYNPPEGNENIVEIEEAQSFTDTQNISYSYLHSQLLLDNNST